MPRRLSAWRSMERPTASGQAINSTPLLDIVQDLIHDILF
jgi:hypothetical protein